MWAKAAKHDSPIWGEEIWPIGAIWFLFALFWTKNIFNIIVKHCHGLLKIGLYSFILSASAVLIDRYFICPPFALFPGISALVFYYVGFVFHRFEVFEKVCDRRWAIFLCLGIWILGIILGTLSIGTCRYQNPAFSVLGAIAACLFWYSIFNRIKVSILVYFGVVSLSVLCVHKLMTALHIHDSLGIDNGWLQAIFDLAVCSILIPLMQQSKFFRSILGLPKLIIKKNHR